MYFIDFKIISLIFLYFSESLYESSSSLLSKPGSLDFFVGSDLFSMLVVVIIDLVVNTDDASINNEVSDNFVVESDLAVVWIIGVVSVVESNTGGVWVVVSDDFTMDVDVEMGSVAGDAGSNGEVGEVFDVVDIGRIDGGQITVAYFLIFR